MSDSSTDKYKTLPLMATGHDGNVLSSWELPFIMVSTLQAPKWALRDEREGVAWPLGTGCWSFQLSYKGSFAVTVWLLKPRPISRMDSVASTQSTNPQGAGCWLTQK